jgi:hypothetical protein
LSGSSLSGYGKTDVTSVCTSGSSNDVTKPAGKNPLQQQAHFVAFLEELNHERPHQALRMKTPGEPNRPLHRPYTGIGDLEYPFHDKNYEHPLRQALHRSENDQP